MTQPIPEAAGEAVELEVGYEYDNEVLTIQTSYGSAGVEVSIDFKQDSAGPDINNLVQALPGIITAVHQQLNQEDSSAQ